MAEYKNTYNDVCELVKQTATINEYGDTEINETRRQVFCEVRSVGMREHYEAFAQGLKPSLVFVLADYYEYEEEQIVEHEGVRYSVERTFMNGASIELTVTKDNGLEVSTDGSTE